MNELLSAVRKSQINCDKSIGQMSDQTGFYEDVSLHDSWLPVLATEVKPFVRPGMKSLELGCGKLFSFSLVLSLLGLQTYGIDARPESIEKASKIINDMERMDLIRKGFIHVVLGNFFPEDFDTNNAIRWDRWADGSNTLKGVDPYQKMGISLSAFDVIAIYQYSSNRNQSLRLAAERCKKDSLVISVGRVQSAPINLKLVHHSESTLTPDFNFYLVESR